MTEINRDEYMENAQGALVPKKQVKDVDLLRDDVVRRLVSQAKETSKLLKEFKSFSFNEIAEFVSISAEQYKHVTKGEKGNISLLSYDGRFKVERAYADKIDFDEQLQIAKEMIYECIQNWSEGANTKLMTMVNFAFQTDRKGQVSADRILGLRRLKIQDEKWLEAMMAISASICITSTKGYVRFYERIGDTEFWSPIPLNIAAD